ncbi:MAG TPA: hypothetical protein VL400_20825 [Polyangiaceae bacterium]|nr:hypothetical protein [Polyangiaceae bacterium]
MIFDRAKLAVSGGACAAVLAFGSTAVAEPTLGGEVRGELSSIGGDLRGGPGVRLSGGYALDTYPILVVPELVLDGTVFVPDPVLGAFRAMGGVRVGFTTVVEPYILTHLGYGFLANDLDLVHGFAIDAGLGLDKRLSRHVTIGGTLAYQGFVGSVNAHGGALGFHVIGWL